jgi:hypothetical protein
MAAAQWRPFLFALTEAPTSSSPVLPHPERTTTLSLAPSGGAVSLASVCLNENGAAARALAPLHDAAIRHVR